MEVTVRKTTAVATVYYNSNILQDVGINPSFTCRQIFLSFSSTPVMSLSDAIVAASKRDTYYQSSTA